MNNMILLEIDLKLFGSGAAAESGGGAVVGSGAVQDMGGLAGRRGDGNVGRLEQRLQTQQAILNLLMKRYGVAEGDLASLQRAVEEDSPQMRQRMLRQRSEQEADRFVSRLRREEKAVKEIYPSFNLRQELQDRNFFNLLRSGIPLQLAYEAKHLNEIKAAAARNAARSAGKQMTARIQSRSARPAENGTSSRSAVTMKSDVSKLTPAERAEIARRVERGETISF